MGGLKIEPLSPAPHARHRRHPRGCAHCFPAIDTAQSSDVYVRRTASSRTSGLISFSREAMALHGDETFERKLRPLYDALDARSWKARSASGGRRHAVRPSAPHDRTSLPAAASGQVGRCGAEEVQRGPAGTGPEGLRAAPQRQAARGAAGGSTRLAWAPLWLNGRSCLQPWRRPVVPLCVERAAFTALHLPAQPAGRALTVQHPSRCPLWGAANTRLSPGLCS